MNKQLTESLDDLKEEYLELETVMGRLTTQTYWRQGQILIKIKEKVGHGKWLRWVEENLNVGKVQLSYRMLVGTLPHLPKSSDIRTFDLERLAEVATIAKKLKLSPDAAAEKWQKNQEGWRDGTATVRPTKFKPRPQIVIRPRTMTREGAFAILGIDLIAQTITKETLSIIEKGLRQKHHPDKGGDKERFVKITKAVELLS